MVFTGSLRRGFLEGRGKFLSTWVLYLSLFLFSYVAVGPFKAGFHRLLDSRPSSKAVCSGGGFPLLGEMMIHERGLWSSGMGALIPLLLLYLVFGLVLMAGVYGLASSQEEKTWRPFWRNAADHFFPFLLMFLLNLVLWAILGACVGGGLAALSRATKDMNQVGVGVLLFWCFLVVIVVTLNLFRNSVGFAQARWVVTGGEEGVWRTFWSGFVFTLRRLVPVNAMTWSFNVLRGLGFLLALVILAPGLGGLARLLATVLLAQLAFFWASYLRVAEARAQVDYTRAFLRPMERRVAEPRPALVEEPAGPTEAPDAGEEVVTPAEP